MSRLAKVMLVTGLATGAVLLGKAYSLWSMERYLHSAAATAAAPGIDLREFERQRNEDRGWTPRLFR